MCGGSKTRLRSLQYSAEILVESIHSFLKKVPSSVSRFSDRKVALASNSCKQSRVSALTQKAMLDAIVEYWRVQLHQMCSHYKNFGYLGRLGAGLV